MLILSHSGNDVASTKCRIPLDAVVKLVSLVAQQSWKIAKENSLKPLVMSEAMKTRGKRHKQIGAPHLAFLPSVSPSLPPGHKHTVCAVSGRCSELLYPIDVLAILILFPTGNKRALALWPPQVRYSAHSYTVRQFRLFMRLPTTTDRKWVPHLTMEPPPPKCNATEHEGQLLKRGRRMDHDPLFSLQSDLLCR